MNETLAAKPLGFLCGKWAVPVVLELSNGARRFTELERSLANVSQKMLSHTLRRLESSGVVSRTVYRTAPLTVEYALTPAGEGGVGLVTSLGLWAQKCADPSSSPVAIARPS